MKSISEWGRLTLENAKNKGFDPNELQDGTQLMLITSELGEALECLRTGEPHIHYGENGKPLGLGSELADVALRLFQYASHKGIDLEEMIEIKHEYNTRRSHKHGGKKF